MQEILHVVRRMLPSNYIRKTSCKVFYVAPKIIISLNFGNNCKKKKKSF
jgi:hypothetical protein